MFFRNNTGGAEWLLVGLGNPGTQYENTRHNVGFLVADELAERQNAPIQRLKFKALTNLLTISGEKVLVMKPVTYMNLSGEAVRHRNSFECTPLKHRINGIIRHLHITKSHNSRRISICNNQ